jgi:hypothetical protein
MLREHQELEADLVRVRVVDDAPLTLPARRRGERDDRDLALEPISAGYALPELGAGEVPRSGEIVLGDGAADELRENGADHAALLGCERSVFRLAVERVADVWPVRVLGRAGGRVVDGQIAEWDDDDREGGSDGRASSTAARSQHTY